MFNFNAAKVVRAYNGKAGCMCGCKGNYSEPGTAATAKRVRKVQAFVGPVRPNGANKGDAVSYSTEAFMGRRYVYVQEGGRNTTVYFSD